ncbi:hypothetical protein DB31_2478 [Hyalangium minutum]|uniref:Uncharacterized protein n=1 Tax=Hyalangium minutum TaxID=394096 RepID=A0A085W7P7_9BACT|nr:hypothetical protein DB31_2478 [Hyalangium minutum]
MCRHGTQDGGLPCLPGGVDNKVTRLLNQPRRFGESALRGNHVVPVRAAGPSGVEAAWHEQPPCQATHRIPYLKGREGHSTGRGSPLPPGSPFPSPKSHAGWCRHGTWLISAALISLPSSSPSASPPPVSSTSRVARAGSMKPCQSSGALSPPSTCATNTYLCVSLSVRSPWKSRVRRTCSWACTRMVPPESSSNTPLSTGCLSRWFPAVLITACRTIPGCVTSRSWLESEAFPGCRNTCSPWMAELA